ncbi:MAG: hypothetical protein HY958_14150 [Bacteroidia bacterium]|nr:hypothetical protein [Bacteroidia bacterium]
MDSDPVDSESLMNFFQNLPDKFSVMEEQIDITVQMEYFDISKKIRENGSAENYFENRALLFNEATATADKKIILAQLASLENIEAFRTIEKYKKNPDHELKDWATLAFLESKTVIENSLTDETQVIISSGLGGKGSKLRYFVILFEKNKNGFSDIQKKIIHSELDFEFHKHHAEIEKIEFGESYVAITCLIPLKAPIKDIFINFISECNLYGDFLQSNYIITNIKLINAEEIKILIDKENFGKDQGTIDINRLK